MPSVLPYLGLPSLFQLRVLLHSLCRFPNLQLYPFPRSQYLALEIEAASLSRLISIKHGLEPLHHAVHIRFTALRWLHVEDLACFFEGETGGGETIRSSMAAGIGACCSRVLGGCCSLSVGFSKSATKDSCPCEDDLGDDTVRLMIVSIVLCERSYPWRFNKP